jgi:hypothetical protein
MADRCEACWHAADLHENGRCRWSGCDCGAPAQLDHPTWAVVPSRGHIMTGFLELARSLRGQADGICLIDNNDKRVGVELEEEAARAGFPGAHLLHLHMPGQPPHLYRMYNAGMDAVSQVVHSDRQWNVLLLNDDVVCPPGWAVSLERALRSGQPGSLAYTDRLGRAELLRMTAPPANFMETATLWAAMVKGEEGLRYDEQFRWWYGDNDFDLRCRLDADGTIAVPGPMPDHRLAGNATSESVELSTIANQHDAPAFNAKWSARMATL